MIEKILNKLEKVKSTGEGKYIAMCPVHNTKSQSLALKEVDDRVIIHCFGGCSTESVLSAIGLTFSDLFPERIPDPQAPKSKFPKFNTFELFPLLIQEAMILAFAWNDARTGKTINEADSKRVQQAFSTVMRLNSEFCRK